MNKSAMDGFDRSKLNDRSESDDASHNQGRQRSSNRSTQRYEKAANALTGNPTSANYLEKIHESLGSQLRQVRKTRDTRARKKNEAEAKKNKSNINLEQLEYIKQISSDLNRRIGEP